MVRKAISPETQMQVLTKSRRRCCLCFWLEGIDELQKGQIAHLDRDSENAVESNLVFLCLNHHDQYDGRTSQSKGFQESEVRHWRDELHCEMRLRSRKDTSELQRKEMFERLETLMKDFLDALRKDVATTPLGRHIVLSDPAAQWSGPGILFVYRDNKIPHLLDKARLLHSHGLLRHDEECFYYITENLANYLQGR